MPGASRDQKRMSEALELSSRQVSHQIESGSFMRATSALNTKLPFRVMENVNFIRNITPNL